MSDDPRTIDPGYTVRQPGPKTQPEKSGHLERNNIGLALRFLVGLLSMGSDEASRRLQDMQRKLDQDPSLWRAQESAQKRTLRQQTWCLSLGLMRRGQKRLQKNLHRGYDLSLRIANQAASASGRLGIRRLARPVQKPLGARLAQWREQAYLIAQEGELEDLQNRALATGTLATLILEIMDEIAKNPEMQDFVQSLIGQQGVGMATSIVDNARAVTLTADDASDALLRWLLRRTPRQELPPSPVEGQPQTMYEPVVEGKASDVN